MHFTAWRPIVKYFRTDLSRIIPYLSTALFLRKRRHSRIIKTSIEVLIFWTAMLTIFWWDFLFAEYFEHKPTLLPAKYLKGLLKSIKAKSLAAKNPKMFYNDARRTLLEVGKLSFLVFWTKSEKKRMVWWKKSPKVLLSIRLQNSFLLVLNYLFFEYKQRRDFLRSVVSRLIKTQKSFHRFLYIEAQISCGNFILRLYYNSWIRNSLE